MDRQEYLKQYRKDWFQRVIQGRRRKWFEEHGPCVDCGSWENLEVDHVDRKVRGTSRYNHAIFTWSEQRREVELAKCVARCHDCHLKKSKREISEFRRELKNPWLRKLTPDQVAEIRRLLARKMPHREIAIRFDTNRGTVGNIGRRETYTDVA